MTPGIGYYRRRSNQSPALRWAWCAGLAVVGIAIGIAGSALAPWGFAPAPGSLEAQAPAPGLLLMSETDYAIVSAVEHTREHAIAVVTFVRGRSGRVGAIARCVEAPGRRLVLELGEQRATWEPDGARIVDKIAQAMCHAHRALRHT